MWFNCWGGICCKNYSLVSAILILILWFLPRYYNSGLNETEGLVFFEHPLKLYSSEGDKACLGNRCMDSDNKWPPDILIVPIKLSVILIWSLLPILPAKWPLRQNPLQHETLQEKHRRPTSTSVLKIINQLHLCNINFIFLFVSKDINPLHLYKGCS